MFHAEVFLNSTSTHACKLQTEKQEEILQVTLKSELDGNWYKLVEYLNESEDNKEDEASEWAQRGLHIRFSQAIHEKSAVRINKPSVTTRIIRSIQVSKYS